MKKFAGKNRKFDQNRCNESVTLVFSLSNETYIWGAKTLAVTICGLQTGQRDSSSENGGMKLKFSGYLCQVKCQKVIENFFQQMLFFGQIRPKCGSFLRQVPPKISKKIEFSVKISVVCA